MTAENIIGFVIQLVVTLIFGGVAVWCFKSKNPVHFWSGSEVKPYEIEDIKKYNRANGIMWIVFTIPQAVAAIATIWAGGNRRHYLRGGDNHRLSLLNSRLHKNT